MEKQQLPFVAQPAPDRPTPRGRKVLAWILIPLILTAYLLAPAFTPITDRWPARDQSASLKSQCPQPAPLWPDKSNDRIEEAFNYLSTKSFVNGTIERLSGAVQIDTQSYDHMGKVGEDKRWDTRYKLHEYLEVTFPSIHKNLKIEKVNTFGLVYTWKGSDDALKPVILMAHQDVVPVPDSTIDAWTHPPFSGHYDGKYIWGRGSSDDKNQLIAAMETAELLLNAGFKPKRTLVLSFGFDEEISGTQGAGHLAPFLHARYGDDGIAAIVDEGAQFEETWGTVFAKPGVGEKGYTDVYITVRMPGGHSSIPSDHTSIGVVSELITMIEAEQYPTVLVEDNPYYSQLQCGAEHSPDFPHKLKKLLSKRSSSHPTCNATKKKKKHHPDLLAIEAAKQGPEVKYLMQTSQAVDVIDGGIKTNALPERVTVTVNHRINVGETPSMVHDRLAKLARKVADKYDLALHAFNGKEGPKSITLVASDTTLLVAPVSPSDASINSPYAVLAGTTRALYGEHIVVAPGIMTGNTDTRYYWDLTRHIFRFAPGYDPEDGAGLGNIHTVDERVSVVNHVNCVKWYMLFVRNMDAADLED